MTRAEVLAEYLGLTPETHPAFFRAVPICPICDRQGTSSGSTCCSCGVPIIESDTDFELTLPDPLAPGTASDAWLGVLVRTKDFWTIHAFTDGFGANVFREGRHSPLGGKAVDPTPAIVRAIMAADPTFREKMEGAEG